MKSVLITTDYVKREDGTLTPVEINTNTGFNVHLPLPNTLENFETNFNDYFDYQSFDKFLKDNNLTKVIVIEQADRYSRIFKLFCKKYNYNFEEIIIGNNSLVPEINEGDNELILRIAYDTYSILDDLYARDMYEFHNLIKNESFASPVYFSSSLDLDTVHNVETPLDQDWPNYILKSRLPGYDLREYPKLYSITTESELTSIKMELSENEFLQKYEIHSGSLQEFDGRHRYFRSSDLVYGENLETLQLFAYQKILEVSIDNENFIYDSIYNPETNRLNPLHSSRFLPIDKLLFSNHFHLDQHDYLIKQDGNLANIASLEKQNLIQTVTFSDNITSGSLGYPLHQDDFQNFSLTTSSIEGVNKLVNSEEVHAFINIKVNHQEYGSFEWYDGINTPYYIQKQGTEDFKFFFVNAGFCEPGDNILVYNRNLGKMVPFTVTEVKFDLKKNLDMYLISLNNSKKFFVEIENEEYPHNNSPFFVIQHNACDFTCTAGSPCTFPCDTCSKNDPGCPDCGGPQEFIVCSI